MSPSLRCTVAYDVNSCKQLCETSITFIGLEAFGYCATGSDSCLL